MAKNEPSDQDKFRTAVIEAHKAKTNAQRAVWDKAVRSYRSQFHEGGTDSKLPETVRDDVMVVENNWLFGFTETLVANICPTNPQVTITHRRPELEDAAKFREALINDYFYRDKLYRKLWKAAGRAVIYPRVFLKVVWSKVRERPSLRVLTPEYVFFDDTAEEWEDIRYLGEVVPMPKAEFIAKVGKKGKKGTNYRANIDVDQIKGGPYPGWLKTHEGGKSEHESAAENFEWVVVYEFYDFIENKLLHYLEGDPVPLYEGDLPYWYLENNFHMLTYNDNLQDIGGLSDAQIVMPTIEALNEMTTLQLWHVLSTIPVMVINESLVDDPDAFWRALQDADGPGKGIGLKAKNNATVGQILGSTPTPSLPVNWESMKADLQGLIEFLLAIASYQRGGLGQSDVATELALSDTALKTRNARRQKEIYCALEWLAESVIGLYTQYMPEDANLPLRLGIEGDVSLVGRGEMAMGSRLKEGEDAQKPDPFSYDYKARPFNAQEQNSIAQLKMLTDFIQLLIQNPHVDQRRMVKWLLELIHGEHILADEEQVAQLQAMAQQQEGGGQPPETMMSGSPDMQGMPPEMAALASGGVVEGGSGSQAVAAGLEGGSQPGGKTIQ